MLNKSIFILTFICALNFSLAQSKVSDEVLEELPSKHCCSAIETEETPKSSALPSSKMKKKLPQKKEIEEVSGNLPSYALRTQPVTQFQTPSVVPKNTDFDQHIGIKRGDVLRALISQNIAVYPGSSSPVTAIVLEGPFKGALLLGEATMDRITKRANISFNSIRPQKSKEAYTLTGDLMSEDGVKGLEGEYDSNYWTYFWAEAITNTVSGFARATTKQNPTIWGTYAADPGVENAARQGVAEGLARTAEKLGEARRTAPEITTVKGPTIVKITVTK